jgi:hypothetical protein
MSTGKTETVTRVITRGDVRCDCGALLFRALGNIDLETKCRRCGKKRRYVTN